MSTDADQDFSELEVRRRVAFEESVKSQDVTRENLDDILQLLTDRCAARTPALAEQPPPTDMGGALLFVRQCCSAVDVWLKDWPEAPSLLVAEAVVDDEDDDEWMSSLERLREAKLQVAACLAGVNPQTNAFSHSFLTTATRGKRVMLAYMTIGLNDFKSSPKITTGLHEGANPVMDIDMTTVVANTRSLLQFLMPLKGKTWTQKLWDYRRHIAFGLVAGALALAGYHHVTSARRPADDDENQALACSCDDLSSHGLPSEQPEGCDLTRGFVVTAGNEEVCDQYACLLRFRMLFGAVTSQKGSDSDAQDYMNPLPLTIGSGSATGIYDILALTEENAPIHTLFSRLKSFHMAMICPLNLFFFSRLDNWQFTSRALFYNRLSAVLYNRALGKNLCPFTNNQYTFDKAAIAALEDGLTAILDGEAGIDDSSALLSSLQSGWDVSAATLIEALEFIDGSAEPRRPAGMVVDPTAEKPADWDDAEDGEWQAPMIPDPEHDEAQGRRGLCARNAAMLARLDAARPSRNAVASKTAERYRSFFEQYHEETRRARIFIESKMQVDSPAGRFLLYQAHPGFIHDVIVTIETERTGATGATWSISGFETLAQFVNPWASSNWVDYVAQYVGDTSQALGEVTEFVQPSRLPLLRQLLAVRNAALRFTVLTRFGAGMVETGDQTVFVEKLLRDRKQELVNSAAPFEISPSLLAARGGSDAASLVPLLRKQVWRQATLTDAISSKSILADALLAIQEDDGPRSFFYTIGRDLLQSFTTRTTEWISEAKMKRDLAEVVQLLVPQLDTTNEGGAWNEFLSDTLMVGGGAGASVAGVGLLFVKLNALISGSAGAAATTGGTAVTAGVASSLFLVAAAAVVVTVAVGAAYYILSPGQHGWGLEVDQLQAMVLSEKAFSEYSGATGLQVNAPNDALRDVSLADIAEHPSTYLPWLTAAKELRDSVPRSPKRTSAVAVIQDSVYAAVGGSAASIGGLSGVAIDSVGYRDTNGILSWFRGNFGASMLQEDFELRQELQRLAFGVLMPRRKWLQDWVYQIKEARLAFLSGTPVSLLQAQRTVDYNGLSAEVLKDKVKVQVRKEIASTVDTPAGDRGKRPSAIMTIQMHFVAGGSRLGQTAAQRYIAALSSLSFRDSDDTSSVFVSEMIELVRACNFLELYDQDDKLDSEPKAIIPFFGLLAPKIADRLPSLQTCEKLALITQSRGGLTPLSFAADSFLVQSTDGRTYESPTDCLWLQGTTLSNAVVERARGQRLVTGIPPCLSLSEASPGFGRITCINRRMLCSKWCDPGAPRVDAAVKSEIANHTEWTTDMFRKRYQAEVRDTGAPSYVFPMKNFESIIKDPTNAVGESFAEITEVLRESSTRIPKLDTDTVWKDDESEWFAVPVALAVNNFWQMVNDDTPLSIDAATSVALSCSTCNYWVRPEHKNESADDGTAPTTPDATAGGGEPVRRPLAHDMYGIMTIERISWFKHMLREISMRKYGDDERSQKNKLLENYKTLTAGVFESFFIKLAEQDLKSKQRTFSYSGRLPIPFKDSRASYVEHIKFEYTDTEIKLAQRLYKNVSTMNANVKNEDLKQTYRQYLHDIAKKLSDDRNAASITELVASDTINVTAGLQSVGIQLAALAQTTGSKASTDLDLCQFVQTFVNGIMFYDAESADDDDKTKQNALTEQNERSQAFISGAYEAHVPTMQPPLASLNWFLQDKARHTVVDTPDGALYKVLLLSKKPCAVEVRGQQGVVDKEVEDLTGEEAGAYALMTDASHPLGVANAGRLSKLTELFLASRGEYPASYNAMLQDLSKWCDDIGAQGLGYEVAIDCDSTKDCTPLRLPIPFLSPELFKRVSRALQLVRMRGRAEYAQNSGSFDLLTELVPRAIREALVRLEDDWQAKPERTEQIYTQITFIAHLNALINQTFAGGAVSDLVAKSELANAKLALGNMQVRPDLTAPWLVAEVVMAGSGEARIARIDGTAQVTLDNQGEPVDPSTLRKTYLRSYAVCYARCLFKLCNKCIPDLIGLAAENPQYASCDVFRFEDKVLDAVSAVSGLIPLVSGVTLAVRRGLIDKQSFFFGASQQMVWKIGETDWIGDEGDQRPADAGEHQRARKMNDYLSGTKNEIVKLFAEPALLYDERVLFMMRFQTDNVVEHFPKLRKKGYLRCDATFATIMEEMLLFVRGVIQYDEQGLVSGTSTQVPDVIRLTLPKDAADRWQEKTTAGDTKKVDVPLPRKCPPSFSLVFFAGLTAGRVQLAEFTKSLSMLAENDNLQTTAEVLADIATSKVTNLLEAHQEIMYNVDVQRNVARESVPDTAVHARNALSLLAHYVTAQLLFIHTNVFRVSVQAAEGETRVIFHGKDLLTGNFSAFRASPQIKRRAKMASVHIFKTFQIFQDSCNKLLHAMQTLQAAEVEKLVPTLMRSMELFVSMVQDMDDTSNIQHTESDWAVPPRKLFVVNPLSQLLQNAEYVPVIDYVKTNDSTIRTAMPVPKTFDDRDDPPSRSADPPVDDRPNKRGVRKLTYPCYPVVRHAKKDEDKTEKEKERQEVARVRAKHHLPELEVVQEKLISADRTQHDCECKPTTRDNTGKGTNVWTGCGPEGWCDVKPGCAGAQEAAGDYDGWDQCKRLSE